MDREVRKILVVDGSASSFFQIGMLLKRLNYEVEAAGSAEEALRKLEEKAASVVLAEAALPNISGVDLLKRIKEHEALKAIPVVMMVSGHDPGIEESCKRLGCADFLFKPIEPEGLYRTIQAVTESIPRANIRLSTLLKVIVGDGTAFGGGVRTESATAISVGGIYIRTLYPQPRNAITPLRIFLPDREIRAKAVVLYSFAGEAGPYREPGMGMRFVEISDADREAVRTFIKVRLSRK